MIIMIIIINNDYIMVINYFNFFNDYEKFDTSIPNYILLPFTIINIKRYKYKLI